MLTGRKAPPGQKWSALQSLHMPNVDALAMPNVPGAQNGAHGAKVPPKSYARASPHPASRRNLLQSESEEAPSNM